MENEFSLKDDHSCSDFHQHTSYPVNIQSNIKLPVFPIHWLSERIHHVLNSDYPEPICYPELDNQTPFGKWAIDHQLTIEEIIILSLALSASVTPELLGQLSHTAKNSQEALFTGGFFMKGSPFFCPTVRTALFLMAGKDIEKRIYHSSLFHPRRKIFTSGLVSLQPQFSSSVFLDNQLIFNDQFLGTILHGDGVRFDSDTSFPVRKSKACHSLSDVVLKEETLKKIDKLRLFAKNMRKLWEINYERKIRNNFICIFSGDPGTGKSHAAEAVGNEFGLPVYKVNFAQMVSKYIGETEKNLEKVFDRFDKQPCILFFDEAESIFSKRTEVNDSHDQHSNNLQSYLLQKVEEFSGIIILATNVHNLTHYFDKAFQRRFRLIVEFEFPDYAERLKLWERSLFDPYVFEKGLTENLAKNYQLSGGSIYNVVSDAVIEALERNTTTIDFQLIENALQYEFRKTSRKYEVCTDEMIVTNPARRLGQGYEQRKNF